VRHERDSHARVFSLSFSYFSFPTIHPLRGKKLEESFYITSSVAYGLRAIDLMLMLAVELKYLECSLLITMFVSSINNIFFLKKNVICRIVRSDCTQNMGLIH